MSFTLIPLASFLLPYFEIEVPCLQSILQRYVKTRQIILSKRQTDRSEEKPDCADQDNRRKAREDHSCFLHGVTPSLEGTLDFLGALTRWAGRLTWRCSS